MTATQSVRRFWQCPNCTQTHENYGVCYLCSASAPILISDHVNCAATTPDCVDARSYLMTIDLVIEGEVVNHSEHWFLWDTGSIRDPVPIG